MNQFDKQIREHLDQQELPFDPKAWEQMSTRLDQVMPVAKTGLPWKSILGLSAVVVTAAAVYFTTGSNSKEPSVAKITPITVSKNNVTSEIQQNTNVNLEQIQETALIFDLNQHIGDDKVISTVVLNSKNFNPQTTLRNTNHKSSQPTIEGAGLTIQDYKVSESDINSISNSKLSIKYLFDLQDTYCENQSLVVENKYGTTFKLVSDNEVVEIPVKASLNIKKLKAGEYTLYNATEKIQSFVVVPIEKTNKVSVIEDYHFDKGVPKIVVQPATQNLVNSWSINGVKMTGNEYAFNAFNKGEYEVSFQTNDLNGCPVEIGTKINVDQNYNLLAPNAINVNSQDQRNRTFIPYALTQRDTPFEMIIVEPSSGRVIFKTTTTEGWDGIDQSSGELIPINKTYIWKVTLFKPLPGEKKEYSNIVTRVQ